MSGREISIELRSSYGQMKDFSESIIWHDMRNELEAWLDDIRGMLEKKDLEVEEFRVLQGNAEAIRYALSLPEVLLAALEAQTKERVEEEEL